MRNGRCRTGKSRLLQYGIIKGSGDLELTKESPVIRRGCSLLEVTYLSGDSKPYPLGHTVPLQFLQMAAKITSIHCQDICITTLYKDVVNELGAVATARWVIRSCRTQALAMLGTSLMPHSMGRSDGTSRHFTNHRRHLKNYIVVFPGNTGYVCKDKCLPYKDHSRNKLKFLSPQSRVLQIG